MATRNFDTQLTFWEVLNTNLKTHLTNLPNLRPGQEDLEERIAQGRILLARQSQLTGALRETIVQRNELERTTNHLRELLDSSLRYAFGTTNPRLNEFGIRPRLRRPRPATTPQSPEPVEPPVSEEPPGTVPQE